MEWFPGNIPQAIQTSKSKGSIFVVYITADDDDTRQMDQAWNDPAVSQMCKQESVVAIKISANSEACTFFSQIYPVVILPAAFFIGENGTPLEVLGGKVEPETFRNKVKSVLELHRNNKRLSATSQEQPPVTQSSEQKPVSAPALAEPGSSSVDLVTLEGAAGSDTEATKPSEGRPGEDLEIRVERAKEKIEQKRIEKAQKEAEEQRVKEIERRKLGQSVQQLRQHQHEQELKEVKEQLRKDKEEERKARERIKQEIERDRAERNAKFQKEKLDKEQQQEEGRRMRLLQQQKEAADAEARRSETARIQFRFPDGTSVSSQFPSSQTLQTAYDFIRQKYGGEVKLSTAFPKKTYGPEDMASTFIELGLAPTSVILVLPNSFSSQVGGGARSLLSILMTPFSFIWNFLMSFLFPAPAVARNSNFSAHSSQGSSASGGDRQSSSTTASKRPGLGSGSRQDGKIRRLNNTNDDDDDDNATWNGNSTQQM